MPAGGRACNPEAAVPSLPFSSLLPGGGCGRDANVPPALGPARPLRVEGWGGSGPAGRERSTKSKRAFRRASPPSALPAGGGGERRRRRWRRLLLLGGDHHDHLPPFRAWSRLYDDVRAEVGFDPRGHLATQFLVAHLATTEADVDLDLVAFLEEATHLAQLDLVVAVVGDRTELHFLDLDLLGLLLGLVGLLLQVELELAEVHDLAHRRIRIGLDLHQIEALILGLLQCFVARQHADHLSVGTDHAYAWYADLVVTAILLVLGANTASPEWGWRTAGSARRGCSTDF